MSRPMSWRASSPSSTPAPKLSITETSGRSGSISHFERRRPLGLRVLLVELTRPTNEPSICGPASREGRRPDLRRAATASSTSTVGWLGMSSVTFFTSTIVPGMKKSRLCSKMRSGPTPGLMCAREPGKWPAKNSSIRNCACGWATRRAHGNDERPSSSHAESIGDSSQSGSRPPPATGSASQRTRASSGSASFSSFTASSRSSASCSYASRASASSARCIVSHTYPSFAHTCDAVSAARSGSSVRSHSSLTRSTSPHSVAHSTRSNQLGSGRASPAARARWVRTRR